MKTLVVNNQKGGVGKTMLAVHAAWHLAEAGARVLFIDLDPQANASSTLSAVRVGESSRLFFGPELAIEGRQGVSLLAGDRGLDAVDTQLTHAVTAFRDAFARLSREFDYAVIDTPPTWSGRNYAALMVASSLLAPIDLETYALQGVRQLLAQKAAVERNARQGRPIDFLGLLPCRFQSQSPRQRASLAALLEQRGLSIMFPDQGVVTQRQGYAEALDVKAPVWTIRKTAAQEAGREILGVLTAIKARLDRIPHMTQFLTAFDDLNQALAGEGDVLLILPLALVYEDPANPRDTFDEAEMAALADTVRENGVLQPIVVRPAGADGRYKIRFGARRFRAAVSAQLTTIPSLVRAGVEGAADSLIEQLIENDQRTSLNTAQLARAIAHLLDQGLTQAQIGARLGRSKERIAMLAALRAMPAALRALAPSLGVRTLYELANAWKTDAARAEAWLRGRDPADITQVQARALAASVREPGGSITKAARVRSAGSTAARPRTEPVSPAVIVEVMVEGRAGRLVLAPGPTSDHALVRFEAAAGAEPVPLSLIRLTGLRAS